MNEFYIMLQCSCILTFLALSLLGYRRKLFEGVTWIYILVGILGLWPAKFVIFDLLDLIIPSSISNFIIALFSTFFETFEVILSLAILIIDSLLSFLFLLLLHFLFPTKDTPLSVLDVALTAIAGIGLFSTTICIFIMASGEL